MHIARRFTTEGQDPYETVAFRSAVSEIRNPDGSVVFAAEGIEVPAEWSQVACDILAQKYLRKAGVPFDLHIYQKGRHGIGLNDKPPFANAHPWAVDCVFWLKEQGFVK